MRPLAALALSLAATALSALALAALALLVPAADVDTARVRALADAGRDARLVIVGNSVADSSLDAPTLGRVALGDPDAVAVLTVPGGGPLHLHALVAGPVADIAPDVIVGWLLPATWRDPAPPAGSDLARRAKVSVRGCGSRPRPRR